eukprot:gene9616-10599_t
MVFDHDKCVILDNNGTVMGSGNNDGKLYSLDYTLMESPLHEAHSAVDKNPLKLWHERFGHLGIDNLKLLNNQKLELNEANSEIRKKTDEIDKLGIAAKQGAEAMNKVVELEGKCRGLVEENKTLTENYNSERLLRKKYYNIVEDMKGKIRVYARARPLSKSEQESSHQKTTSQYDTMSEMMVPLLKQLERRPPIKLMSIGAGNGIFEDKLIKQFGLKVEYFHGVEPDCGRREKLQEIVKTWELATESFIDHRLFDEDFKSDTKFDLILMSHVLYSIPGPTEAIIRAKTLLKKEGKLKVKVLFDETTPCLANGEVVIEDIAEELHALGVEYKYFEAPFQNDFSDFITRQGGDNDEKGVFARNHVISFLLQTRFEKLPADLQSEICHLVKNACTVQYGANNMKKYFHVHPMGMLLLEGN